MTDCFSYMHDTEVCRQYVGDTCLCACKDCERMCYPEEDCE